MGALSSEARDGLMETVRERSLEEGGPSRVAPQQLGPQQGSRTMGSLLEREEEKQHKQGWKVGVNSPKED